MNNKDHIEQTSKQSIDGGMDTLDRVQALAEFLEVEEDEIEASAHDETEFEHGRATYLVLTDKEADTLASERIRDSLWAFNAPWLASQTGLPQVIFDALVKGDLHESANEAVEALIVATCGLDTFCKRSIEADGHGYLIADYDHEENEQGEFYIYRTN